MMKDWDSTGLGLRLRRLSRNLYARYHPAPHGVDVFRDIRRNTDRRGMAVMFDVGANVGQTALRYLREFPEARIYAFEPVRETYEALHEALRDHDRAQCFHLAMGASEGETEIVLQTLSIENSLLNAPSESQGNGGPERTERVRVDTVDAFCTRAGIEFIDFLKVDTEGYDLEVLKGAEQLLRSQRIAFVQTEVGGGAHNTKHVPLHTMQQHLEDRGYSLFGCYEQMPEFWNGMPRLRFCNAVFISQIEVNAAHGVFVAAAGAG